MQHHRKLSRDERIPARRRRLSSEREIARRRDQLNAGRRRDETGGGHTNVMAFPAEALKVTGTLRFHEVKTDSGNVMRRGFFPTCGSPVLGTTSGLPDVTAISTGSLDDPSVFKPQFVCYTSRDHAWDLADAAVPSFPKMPPTPSAAEPPARSA